MIITVTCNPSYDRTLEIPNFTPGETVTAHVVRRQPAGKGVNVSGCIAGLGRTSIASGFIGKSEGPLFLQRFAATGTTADFVEVAGNTRQNTTILDPHLGSVTHIREEGFTVNEEDVRLLAAKLAELTHEGDFIIFAGSLPTGMAPADLARLVQQCRALDCYVAVDSSGDALASAVEAQCTIIKPNLEELQELTGGKMSSEQRILDAAQQILERVKIVLVTVGAAGAYCITRSGAWKANAVVEGVQNTVGAGDAFLAGFAVHYAEGAPLNVCLREAVACGSASTIKRWAGELDAAEVERLSKVVELAEL